MFKFKRHEYTVLCLQCKDERGYFTVNIVIHLFFYFVTELKFFPNFVPVIFPHIQK